MIADDHKAHLVRNFGLSAVNFKSNDWKSTYVIVLGKNIWCPFGCSEALLKSCHAFTQYKLKLMHTMHRFGGTLIATVIHTHFHFLNHFYYVLNAVTESESSWQPYFSEPLYWLKSLHLQQLLFSSSMVFIRDVNSSNSYGQNQWKLDSVK